ncbi:MAG: class I tRNA ligase family protein [Pirellulales bacterium]
MCSVPERELAIGQFWKSRGIYEKSLALRADAKPFVFYEGPPTANGMPHPGHCLTRSIKDLFPRYRTMRGQRCVRKAGWDTHGLPVEVEVCKELGIHSKEEIEAYGVEPFIQKCQQSVWRYMREWEQLTERLGFWVDMKDAYVTYHQSYVESVWWSLKNLFDRGLLYQGHKIVWWWAQGGTALSAGEVGQGYRKVADPSVYVRFPLLDDKGQETCTSLLVWTTTPWTLPSNQFAAVHPELTYATVVCRDLEQEDTKPGDTEPEDTKVQPNSNNPIDRGMRLIIAADLVETIAGKVKCELEVESTCLGSELIGRRYRPPFDCFYRNQGDQTGTLKAHADGEGTQQHQAWRVIGADFVTLESGTGLVHQAPAFGEVDYEVLQAEQARFVAGEGPDLICAVGPDGKFTQDMPEYAGQWVKDCDKPINRCLRERGLLFHQEQVNHDYPFCWRADQDPLIQYPRESWFISTKQFKEQMLANNAKINWMPDHIQDGRFGNFLASNVDWALSRERYWGTPLPIWVCDETAQKEAIDSYDELLAKPGITGTQMWEEAKRANPELPDDLRVHKPYIDELTYDSPFAPGAKMRRVTEVIDCWYDSGAMPFAQWGYRGQQQGPVREQFEDQFPADFISEALDQTRGWFYSQLAISTLLFGGQKAESGKRNEEDAESNSALGSPPSTFPHPYRNCIVLGLMLGEDGQKMSKSKRNYLAPSEIFDTYGADTLRWYFFANQPPWTSIRYSEQAIKESIPEFLLRLWNVTSFFTIYANIDHFFPADELTGMCGQLTADDLSAAPTYRPLQERSELDRWILSELYSMVAEVIGFMDSYDSYAACGRITHYVDALSNWYVRRSRDRFWSNDKRAAEKLDAYWTLYECLITTAKVVAPFVPFLAETLWQNLAAQGFGDRIPESIHLCDYPEVTESRQAIDSQLSVRMNLVRHISSLGRKARASEQLKVRQPLARVEVILVDTLHQPWLEQHASVIADELNVKRVEFSDEPDKFVEHEVLPNFKLLGPKLGRLMPRLKQELSQHSGAQLLANIRDNGFVNLTIDGQEVELSREEIEIRLKARPGWASANDQGVVVVLATELTEELIAEGVARDLVRTIQDLRKELGCEFTDRIEVGGVSESPQVITAVTSHADYICRETLANSIGLEPLPECQPHQVSVGSHEVELYVRVL